MVNYTYMDKVVVYFKVVTRENYSLESGMLDNLCGKKLCTSHLSTFISL